MTKLTEAAKTPTSCIHDTCPGFKSGWLAALEEVAKAIEATKGKDNPRDGYDSIDPFLGAQNDGRQSLRAEMAKVLEGLKS